MAAVLPFLPPPPVPEGTSPAGLVLGYSGGLDSTVLLQLLARAPDRGQLPLRAVHVCHGLDPAARGTRRERVLASMGAVEAYEDGLRAELETALAELPGVTLWSRATHRTPTLLLTFDGRDAADAYRFLAQRGVNAPAGSFYALEPSRWLGLGDAGGLRVGLAPYSDADDVARLVAGLREWLTA